MAARVVGPSKAGEDDKHEKAVHFLAKRRKVFSAMSQNSRDGEAERRRGGDDRVSLYALIRKRFTKQLNRNKVLRATGVLTSALRLIAQ